MAEIRINYTQVMSRAEEIRKQSENMGKEISILENIYEDIQIHWKGPAAEAYLCQIDHLLKSMKSTKYRMGQVVDMIKEVARQIKSEDINSADKAKALK